MCVPSCVWGRMPLSYIGLAGRHTIIVVWSQTLRYNIILYYSIRQHKGTISHYLDCQNYISFGSDMHRRLFNQIIINPHIKHFCLLRMDNYYAAVNAYLKQKTNSAPVAQPDGAHVQFHHQLHSLSKTLSRAQDVQSHLF